MTTSLVCTSIGTPDGFQFGWVANLIGIRTPAVERGNKLQEVILRTIDGRVKRVPSRREPGDFGRLRSVHSGDSTDQSEMSTECRPRVFNKSIRIAE